MSKRKNLGEAVGRGLDPRPIFLLHGLELLQGHQPRVPRITPTEMGESSGPKSSRLSRGTDPPSPSEPRLKLT